MEEAIRSNHPINLGLQDHELNYEMSWHKPDKLELPVVLRAAKDDLPLLSVAHGLTLERAKWPIVFEPGEIETLVPTTQIEKPEAYGYVGGK